MLNFKSVRIQDKKTIDSYLKVGSQTCDRAFANLFCWQHFYKTQWAEYENWLVIRAYINGERRAAYIPVSKNESPHYEQIIPALLEEAKQNKQNLTLMGLDDKEIEILKNCCSNDFIFDKNRDFADYVYKSEDLRTLKGRKYAQKRNHVNKFKLLYDFRYEPISKNNIPDCLKLEENWLQQHRSDNSTYAEYDVIKSAFDNYDELDLTGGALYVGDNLVAFTYGSALNGEMFCTHVEKGDISYEGVYQMINYLFAQHLPDNYVYINREEDMGLKGLRKSKMSYEPERLNYKNTALVVTPDMRDIICVWKKCFGEEDTYIYPFLSRYYFEHCSFVKRINGKIVAMLFMVPCATEIGKAAYVYGVATLPECRNQGFSTELMRQFIEHCRKKRFDFAFLIAENEALTDFYARFGYVKTSMQVNFDSDMNLGTGIAENDTALVLPLQEDFNISELPEQVSCKPLL